VPGPKILPLRSSNRLFLPPFIFRLQAPAWTQSAPTDPSVTSPAMKIRLGESLVALNRPWKFQIGDSPNLRVFLTHPLRHARRVQQICKGSPLAVSNAILRHTSEIDCTDARLCPPRQRLSSNALLVQLPDSWQSGNNTGTVTLTQRCYIVWRRSIVA
jgi:hypothetical protein